MSVDPEEKYYMTVQLKITPINPDLNSYGLKNSTSTFTYCKIC
jgi:hypothetical protein